MPVPVEITIGPRRHYRRDLPASWTEVPEARRSAVVRALLSAPGEVGRIAAIRVLLDVPRRIFRLLDADHALALLDALPWLKAAPSPFPMLTTFRHRRRDYFLPNAHGMNMSALEYPIADDAFKDYLQSGKPAALALLCGTLCREAEPDQAAAIRRGDRRIPLLSRGQAEHRAGLFGDLPEWIQGAVLLYFAGVKEFIHGSYGKVLFEEPETDEHGNPIGGGGAPSLGWWSVYFTVATDGPFGIRDQVYQAGFHDVCLYLVDRIRAQREADMRARLASKGFGDAEK